jgi:cell division protein FtsN
MVAITLEKKSEKESNKMNTKTKFLLILAAVVWLIVGAVAELIHDVEVTSYDDYRGAMDQ